jgi:hypothetical protein
MRLSSPDTFDWEQWHLARDKRTHPESRGFGSNHRMHQPHKWGGAHHNFLSREEDSLDHRYLPRQPRHLVAARGGPAEPGNYMPPNPERMMPRMFSI